MQHASREFKDAAEVQYRRLLQIPFLVAGLAIMVWAVTNNGKITFIYLCAAMAGLAIALWPGIAAIVVDSRAEVLTDIVTVSLSQRVLALIVSGLKADLRTITRHLVGECRYNEADERYLTLKEAVELGGAAALKNPCDKGDK